jgi:hypothetical protein
LALLAGLTLFLHHPPAPVRLPTHRPTDPQTYPTSNKPSDLHRFVEAHKADTDTKTQDLVGHARIALAYDAASRKDWKGARAMLLTAAREYKGTNAISGEFGGVPDQARYQAAACLMAVGKKEEAKVEFLKFLHEDRLSPLCHAAYRRLVMLNGNKSTPELENLLQKDVSAQEARERLDISSCGPKCIEHLLALQSGRTATLKPTHLPTGAAIAALCGTTEKGTTIEGMCEGLKALGIEGHPYLLNASDLSRAPAPAIILKGDHYLLIEGASHGKANVYDPQFGTTREMSLPNDDSIAFPTILFQTLHL